MRKRGLSLAAPAQRSPKPRRHCSSQHKKHKHSSKDKGKDKERERLLKEAKKFLKQREQGLRTVGQGSVVHGCCNLWASQTKLPRSIYSSGWSSLTAWRQPTGGHTS